jgi:hypothetical protein
MTYRFLAANLHEVADSARVFMVSVWGISNSKVEVESPIEGDIVPAPTLQAPGRDHHIVCVEVSGRAFPPHLNAVVADCVNRGLPVELYVALPEPQLTTEDLQRAKRFGVGVLLVGVAGCQCFLSAQSLSLTGVRHPDPKTWPAKYKHDIFSAHQNFVNGDPSKGCALIFDLIESVTRRICARAAKKGWWRNLPTGTKVPDATNPKVPLSQVAKFLYEYFDPAAASVPKLDSNVLGSVVGIIGQRNDSAHPPKDLWALKKRDLRARTRFENAVDVLRDLVMSAAPLRV